MSTKGVLDSAFEAVFSRQPFLPGRKWEQFPRPPPLLPEKRPEEAIFESEAPKKFRSEVPSRQHNVQEGLTGGVQEKTSWVCSKRTETEYCSKCNNETPCKSASFSKEKFKYILSIIHISDWVTKEMYLPLKEVLANAPKAGQLAIAKQNWEKVTSDPWVLQTVQGYSLELITVPTQSFPPRQVHLPGRQEALMREEIKSLLEKGPTASSMDLTDVPRPKKGRGTSYPLFYRALQRVKHATLSHFRGLDSAIAVMNQEREELL